MVFQNDYIAMNIREQQIKEYIREAENDHLVASLNAHRSNLIAQFVRNVLHGAGQRLEEVKKVQHVQISNVASSK